MPMMQCGHAAQGYADNDPGKPVCVICAGLDPRAYLVAEEPDLKGRRARCAYFRTCGSEVDSSTSLAFFEYTGLGSKAATEICMHCGFSERAHKRFAPSVNPNPGPRNINVCSGFEPHGAHEHDEYYCGCHGWN